jgi:tRNA-specific 2-thiouridylase
MENNSSNNQKHVMVAMSGGVDSSLTAALLVEQGYQVSGAYMKNWAESDDELDCPWAQDVYDANQVAKQLGIHFRVFDLRQQYQDRVVDYMVKEYQAGRTPNPDIMCNQEMKFGIFWELAQQHGADYMATGHYSRTRNGQLLAGLDTNKDQSYFLYRAPVEALNHTLMPVGELTKPQVRIEAAKRSLFTATKKDSQGICFIGKIKLKDFLQRYMTVEPGELINQHGQLVGQHAGAVFYTIGQRNGMGVGGGLPYFVTGKNMATNQVFVTTDPVDPNLWQSEILLDQLHWLGQPPTDNQPYQARVRYRGPLVPASTYQLSEDLYRVVLSKPQRALALGQSLVIYDGDKVIGGGIMTKIENCNTRK